MTTTDDPDEVLDKGTRGVFIGVAIALATGLVFWGMVFVFAVMLW